MGRVKHAVSTHRRKKRLLKRAKGQFAQRSRRYRQARKSVARGLVYAYRDRKAHKRQMRSLWIVRINAACREHGVAYSRFIKGLSAAKVEIDRKQLAELAVHFPDEFKKLVELAQAASPAVSN